MLDYSRNGGKCIYITRNHGYPEFFVNNRYLVSEILSKLTGVAWVIKESMFPRGNVLTTEFLGANSNDPDYSDIEADSSKGWDFQWLRDVSNQVDTVYAAGHVPAIGALQNLPPGAEVLYTYQSAYESSQLHGNPVAIKRITDSTATIWFNFPLSLMNHEQAWRALTQAVADLGIDTVNNWSPPPTTTRSIIEWLYGRSSAAYDPAWDINHDGIIDIRDVVEELDR